MALNVLLVAGSQGLLGCSDTWDDHYGVEGSNGQSSLLQLIEQHPQQLSDFLALLKATHVYNNNHATPVTYAELLDADQALTVWAPLDGTYDAASLLAQCATPKGDSIVGQHFVKNHIAHNLYNMNGETAEQVKMLNDKILQLDSRSLYNASVVPDLYNLPATNGLLHLVGDDALYTYNIYEALTSMENYSHIGSFLARYERQELDEDRSIQAGIVDGQKVYSDSVMTKENVLFRVFDQIMSEDSAFMMLVPDEQTWRPVYEEARSYFNFGSVERADSISDYWTNVSLIRDLIYNTNVQRSPADSLFSTSYTPREWPYHVYERPYDAGGLMELAAIGEQQLCSNGYIYNIGQWPFTPEQLYFHPITMQGEREANIVDSKDCTFNFRSAIGDSISGNGYVDIVPLKSTSNWKVTYEIRNTLSGTYDIYAVLLPKTVYLANSRDFKPNKFKATLNYLDEAGEKQSVKFDTEMSNNSRRADSVLIGRFTFPTCNYQQPDATVSLMIECSILPRQTSFSREMFLDCIFLKPVSEDETPAGAKNRKEVQQ